MEKKSKTSSEKQKNIEFKNLSNDVFDKHEGVLRTEKKVYGKTWNYRGFEIKQNKNVPQGADGRIEVPKLKWWTKGGMQTGFLTVSKTQAMDAIDKYMKYNIEISDTDDTVLIDTDTVTEVKPIKNNDMAKNEFDLLSWYENTLKQLLEPCPICGEEKEIAIHVPNKDGKEDVQCLKCGLKMEKALGNSKGAVAWWNTRVKK